jgi:hypothetical protein
MSTQKQQKRRVTVLLDEDQYERIQNYSKKFCLTPSDILRYGAFRIIEDTPRADSLDNYVRILDNSYNEAMDNYRNSKQKGYTDVDEMFDDLNN